MSVWYSPRKNELAIVRIEIEADGYFPFVWNNTNGWFYIGEFD